MKGGNCLESAALPPYPELIQDFQTQTVPKEEQRARKPSFHPNGITFVCCVVAYSVI